MNYKIVEVEWIDAHSSMDSITLSELRKQKPFKTRSCGYLIHKDNEKTILAFMVFGFNYEQEPILKHYQVIPTKMIKKIKEIRESEKI